ncbi:MAG: CarD family transcriptional regulator [Pseudobutyrivibrio sp.]|nr:CarD family transcriptional regulator [Pseudobutyrivibrio sp.]
MKYKVGDYLVHETSGICRIEDIDDLELMGKGSLKTYYVMSAVFKPSAKVFTPVEGSSVRLRQIASQTEITELLDSIKDIPVIKEPNDRLRQELFKETLSEFTLSSLAIIVKTVLLRKSARVSMGKKVMASDEKTLALAGRKLYEEMAFSLNKDLDEVQHIFEDKVKEYSNMDLLELIQ